MLKDLTGSELDDSLIDSSNKIILVVFSAPFSGESRMLDEVINEVSEKYNDGDILFARIDADEEPQFAADKGVYEIPTVMIYANSELIYYRRGMQSKFSLFKELDQAKEAIGTQNA